MAIIRYTKDANIKYAYLNIFPDQFKTEKQKKSDDWIKNSMDYFANQAYANFKSVRFGISTCCFTDLQDATIDKDICDWQNAKSNKIIVSTNTAGIFLEPIAKVNETASITCPVISTNVCTVLDLEDILADTNARFEASAKAIVPSAS